MLTFAPFHIPAHVFDDGTVASAQTISLPMPRRVVATGVSYSPLSMICACYFGTPSPRDSLHTVREVIRRLKADLPLVKRWVQWSGQACFYPERGRAPMPLAGYHMVLLRRVIEPVMTRIVNVQGVTEGAGASESRTRTSYTLPFLTAMQAQAARAAAGQAISTATDDPNQRVAGAVTRTFQQRFEILWPSGLEQAFETKAVDYMAYSEHHEGADLAKIVDDFEKGVTISASGTPRAAVRSVGRNPSVKSRDKN